MSPGEKPTPRRPTRADLWKCEDLKQLIREQIRTHVKDVELAKKIEQALGDRVAYGDGGGGTWPSPDSASQISSHAGRPLAGRPS
jgi:hypothetical protein